MGCRLLRGLPHAARNELPSAAHELNEPWHPSPLRISNGKPVLNAGLPDQTKRKP